MRIDVPQLYADLLNAAERRRGSAPMRAVVGFAIAAIIDMQLGLTWIYLWATAYAAAQLWENWFLGAARVSAWARPTLPRATAILATFTLPAVLYAPLAIPIWSGAQYGPVMSVLLLAGGGLHLLVMSGPSIGAFLAPFSVYIGVWVSLLLTEQRLAPETRGLAAGLALLVVANSIMAWRTQAKALNQARASAKEAERRRLEMEAAIEAKGAFVAMISHDLRTPIGAILAGADKIERGGDGARHYAKLVREAGVMMRDLLGDLLDMERMDAGAMPVEQIPFNLRQTLAECLQLWRGEAARNGLQLRAFGGHDMPRDVSGDPTRIRQVLNNLLSNAVKFTEAGSVTVRMSIHDERLSLAVEDTGPGLGAGAPERLFQPFDQEPGMARRHGGFGLGLAISRKRAQLMGGDLWASNLDDGGARFVFDVPLTEAVAAPVRHGPLRVLVVDDHSINREAVKILLEPLGVAPVLAEDGAEALGFLAAERFDLVLMDINMPVMDGREATRQLRASGGPTSGIPVIAVSAADTPREWRACSEAGMNSHVAKPIRPHRLYEAINAALLLDQGAQELEAQALEDASRGESALAAA